MSGIDAITTIRAQFPEGRIIVLTIYPGDVQVTRVSQVGVHGYVLKGLPRKELLETIRAGAWQKWVPVRMLYPRCSHERFSLWPGSNSQRERPSQSCFGSGMNVRPL
jgi:DNA-binding NarL/FixJ family response regulator